MNKENFPYHSFDIVLKRKQNNIELGQRRLKKGNMIQHVLSFIIKICEFCMTGGGGE